MAEIAHFTTVARLIRGAAFRGMGVDQFLASEVYTAGFKQTDWRYSSRPICHSVSGSMSLTAPGTGPQVIGVAHCIPTVGFDRGDPATRNRYPLGWLRTLGSYPPRSGLERSDLVRWPISEARASYPLSGAGES